MGAHVRRLSCLFQLKLRNYFSVDELKQLDRCTDITLQLGIQDLSNIKKEDLKRLANYALECVVSFCCIGYSKSSYETERCIKEILD